MAPSGHRKNLQPKSSAEIFIRAVPIVSIKLVGPNTAMFGINKNANARTSHCMQKGGLGAG